MKKTITLISIAFSFILGLTSPSWGTKPTVRAFNHQFHNCKVFKPQKIECSSCHNFSVNPETKKAILLKDYEKSSLHESLRSICHSCHQSGEPRYAKAPKTCYTCHRSIENIKTIRPKDHFGIGWKS